MIIVLSLMVMTIKTNVANAALIYNDHVVSTSAGHGRVYDSSQNITWTQLEGLSPSPYSWGTTNSR
jgi:hypothetical protein